MQSPFQVYAVTLFLQYLQSLVDLRFLFFHPRFMYKYIFNNFTNHMHHFTTFWNYFTNSNLLKKINNSLKTYIKNQYGNYSLPKCHIIEEFSFNSYILDNYVIKASSFIGFIYVCIAPFIVHVDKALIKFLKNLCV